MLMRKHKGSVFHSGVNGRVSAERWIIPARVQAGHAGRACYLDTGWFHAGHQAMTPTGMRVLISNRMNCAAPSPQRRKPGDRAEKVPPLPAATSNQNRRCHMWLSLRPF